MNLTPFFLCCAVLPTSIEAQVSFTGSDYTQNFNSMGLFGTSAPTGWSVHSFSDGDKSTWSDSTGIPASDVAGGTLGTTLTPSMTFTASSSSGWNFAQLGKSSDRALGTSPTGSKGLALQLAMTNDSGSPITLIRIGYDIRRFTATANQLPGYWLFYSTDNGTSWTHATDLNPTNVTVPDTVGTSTFPITTISLAAPWTAGTPLLLRWIDDNADETTPDQIYGLDNVTLGAVVGLPPVVALTSPSVNSAYFVGNGIQLAASASDPDGSISKVEFHDGVTKLGEDTTAPYTFNWTEAAIGSHSITAKAIDNIGNASTTTAVTVFVNETAGSGALLRGPYLQMAAANRMTIRWRSSQAIVGRVRYGLSQATLATAVDESAAGTDHEITLTGLNPNTTYFYSIGSTTDTLLGDVTTTFTTPPASGTASNTRIWILGDAGTGSSEQTQVRDAFYSWAGSNLPKLVLQLGDNAYDSGLDSEYQSMVFDIYGSLMRQVPFWSCLGNHETDQATEFVNGYPYFSIYTLPTAAECGGVASGTEHYYSFDYGNIHFISLDSMTASRSPTGAMATWLASDLAANTATWTIAFFHHPPYTKGSHDSDSETELIEMRENLLPILEQGGVDLVVNGHSHCYERSYLLDGHYGTSETLTPGMKLNPGDGRPGGNGAYIKPLTGPRDHFGAVYAVSGSSGQTSGGSLDHPAHFISLSELGSLVLEVNGSSLNASFLRETGTIQDTFTILKQGAADHDLDGVSDAFELAWGMNRFNPGDSTSDNDHDGNNALAEYLFGLNPTRSDRFTWTTTRSGNAMIVSFPTLPQRTYRVYWSKDLLSWSPASAVVTGDGTTKQWTDDGSVTGSAPGSAVKSFYRVSVSNGP